MTAILGRDRARRAQLPDGSITQLHPTFAKWNENENKTEEKTKFNKFVK